MEKVSIIGLTWQNGPFRRIGALADGGVAFRKKLSEKKFWLSCRAPALHRRHGEFCACYSACKIDPHMRGIGVEN